VYFVKSTAMGQLSRRGIELGFETDGCHRAFHSPSDRTTRNVSMVDAGYRSDGSDVISSQGVSPAAKELTVAPIPISASRTKRVNVVI
jgi:hypothetical protein